MTTIEIENLLSQRINKSDIKRIVKWAITDSSNKDTLYCFSKSQNERISVNALWCLTHLSKSEASWLHSIQNNLIDRLLVETHTAKKRIILQLLRNQHYEKDSLRTDFLDYCLSKINSECEPYAIRCFSIYCAFKMCRHFPELISELEEYLNMLSSQSLSPGLLCALRTTHQNIQLLQKTFR